MSCVTISNNLQIQQNVHNNQRICNVNCEPNGVLGLHLTRAPWDPYPCVSDIQKGSSADTAGIRTGDYILEVNGENMIGKRITEIADRIRSKWYNLENEIKNYNVTFLLWNSRNEQNNGKHQNLQKFTTCLQNITQLLECPVCLEVVKPPVWQCCHGHILCDHCRKNTLRCPICRVQLGPRGRCLLAEKVFILLYDTFPCDDNKIQHNTKDVRLQRLPINHKNANLIESERTKKPLNLKNYLPLHLNSNKSLSNKVNQLMITSSTSYQLNHHHHRQQQQQQQQLENIYENRQRNYYCPTGRQCDKMKNQHELLIHLQKIHKISVTQYYCELGERLNIKFMDKSIVAIVLQRNPNENDIFFVVKMKCINNKNNNNNNNNINDNTSKNNNYRKNHMNNKDEHGEICWLWYLGENENIDDYKIKLECSSSSIKDTQIATATTNNDLISNLQWIGHAISLEYNLNDVLKSSKYAPFDKNFDSIYIEINRDY